MIGAGQAGLSAAYHLRHRGYTPAGAGAAVPAAGSPTFVVLDADDAPERDTTKPFHASLDSKVAYAEGSQAADIAREQNHINAVIFQFG